MADRHGHAVRGVLHAALLGLILLACACACAKQPAAPVGGADAASARSTPSTQIEAQRRTYLIKQLEAMSTRMQMPAGVELPFDAES